jgi:hypothetical protein
MKLLYAAHKSSCARQVSKKNAADEKLFCFSSDMDLKTKKLIINFLHTKSIGG